jgi:hypothetical protein
MSGGHGAQKVFLQDRLSRIRSEYNAQVKVMGGPSTSTANKMLIAQNDLMIALLDANNYILQQIRNGEK